MAKFFPAPTSTFRARNSSEPRNAKRLPAICREPFRVLCRMLTRTGGVQGVGANPRVSPPPPATYVAEDGDRLASGLGRTAVRPYGVGSLPAARIRSAPGDPTLLPLRHSGRFRR